VVGDQHSTFQGRVLERRAEVGLCRLLVRRAVIASNGLGLAPASLRIALFRREHYPAGRKRIADQVF
jgi:hypothetical protein